MKIKRAIAFGVMLWVGIFAIISILMFTPSLQDKDFYQFLILWILLIPLVLLLAKWYFREDSPTTKKGFLLGIIGVLVGTVLDIAITVPLFVKSYSVFYSNVFMYIGIAEGILLATYAGFEFDATYTMESKKTEIPTKDEE
ncbi:hypothetical protein HOF40_04190 [Candidatus Parcubacteria bacterium]|jgi:hypothetical protein|nr:hypothetical protein [Candidatus Parcubacteria bacterium]MBT3949262.1 hypothetical protein [Candidatus Parcubacteria bacterium]